MTVITLVVDVFDGQLRARPGFDDGSNVAGAGHVRVTPSRHVDQTAAAADPVGKVGVRERRLIGTNDQIARESIVVASAAGAIVAGSRTWDAAGKVLTFNPTADLTNSTTYVVTIGGVVDIYGQGLAAVVKNFTTTA